MESVLTEEDAEFLRRARDLRHLMDGEWYADVFILLRSGPKRYSQIMVALHELSGVDPWSGSVRSIQKRQLTRTLRRLEDAGLIHRDEEPGNFSRVVLYSLTPAAREYLDLVEPVIDWAERHADLIETVQRLHAELRQAPDPREPEDDGEDGPGE